MNSAIPRITRTISCLTAGLLLAAAAHAQTLTVGLKMPIRTVDPHFYNIPANNAFSRHIFEALVSTDAKLAVHSALAVSWQRSGDTTWEFRLRRDVKFHDGSDFTVDDVLYSYSRAGNVPHSPAGYSRYTAQIVAVDKVDSHTLRIKTARAHPSLLHDLANIRIISLKAAEGKTTREINSGQGVVGTGPYKFLRWQPGKPAVLERNDSYWGASPAWGKVIFLPFPNDKARIAALVKGKVQLIDAVPADRVKTLKKRRKLALAKSISNRLVFLQVDSGRNGSPFITGTRGKNPLRRREVRKAVSLAINRKTITGEILKGGAIPAGQLLPKGVAGAPQDLPPDKYDPRAARRQLARGGYPSGFGLTLHGPRGHLPNDVEVLKAVAVGLKRIGIVTQVESKPSRIFFPLAAKRQFSMFLSSWRLESADAAAPLTALLATFGGRDNWGSNNFGRFSNRDLDAVLASASTTMEESRRAQMLREATRIGMRDHGIIPLYFEVNRWAMRKNLRFRTRIDGITLAMNVTTIR